MRWFVFQQRITRKTETGKVVIANFQQDMQTKTQINSINV